MAEPAIDGPRVVQIPSRRPAGRARMRRRHWAGVFTFLLIVALPLASIGTYLWTRADDQFASRAAFAVRQEEGSAAIALLGGIADLGGGGSTLDTDILHDFITSAAMVRAVDARLDLAAIYAAPGDPVFGLSPDAAIEGVVRHWRRMVSLDYDRMTGLIALEVRAFDPHDARAVAEAVLWEADATINRLAALAREDVMARSEAELSRAADRLREARTALAGLRSRSRTLDPAAEASGRMGLLASLEGQLAEALIDLDLLHSASGGASPRIAQAERRVTVIEDRIAAERARLAGGGIATDADDLAAYEALAVDLQFAEEAYVAALAARDAARAEAERRSRYLAVHVSPTLAETPEYPRRWLTLGGAALTLLMAWSVLVLVIQSLRDRR